MRLGGVHDPRGTPLLKRLSEQFPPLETVIRFASEGIHSGKDEVFFIGRAKADKLELESPPMQPLAKGKDIHRYDLVQPGRLKNVVVYPYDLSTGDALNETVLKREAPNLWGYLLTQRDQLSGRGYFDKSNKKWFELWCQRTPDLYMVPKIVGPEIAARGEFTIANDPLFINNKLKALVFRPELKEDLLYVLGILNSSLLVYFHRAIAPPKGGGFFEVKTEFLKRLPYRKIDFDDQSDQAAHTKIVSAVTDLIIAYRSVMKPKIRNHEKPS